VAHTPLRIDLQGVILHSLLTQTPMKTATQYTIKLDLEEMTILRDLVRIGMKSKYYREYTTEEIDDYMCEDIRDRNVVAVMQFVNLNPVNQIEAMFDTKLFEGLVTV
jgi:hypothetical protein